MKKQITVVFLLCVFLLTGCTDANSTEVQQTFASEQTEKTVSEEINLEETNVMEGESVSEEEVTDEQEDAEEEESVTFSESTETESTTEPIGVYRNIPIEEVVYEENDVVFVIAKRFCLERGDIDYGYLILAGGKVVPFEVSFDDYFSEEIGMDYGRVLDMEAAEPIMKLDAEIIKYYIEKFKNMDAGKEMSRQSHGYDYEYEHIFIKGRRVDCDKYVDYVELYSYTNVILEPTDPNAIEIMNWLRELNKSLSEETGE